MGSLCMWWHQDCHAIGDTAKTSPRVPSIAAHIAILTLIIIQVIPSRQIYVANDNPSLITSDPSVLLLVAISRIPCMQLTMFPTLKTCIATGAGAFHTSTNFETGCKLPEFSDIVVRARVNQFSTIDATSSRSLISNSCCRCHQR
jgi:cytochrome c553